MLHADDELLHQIIRAAHDPDPRRAAGYRPFADPTARRLLGAAQPVAVPVLRVTWSTRLGSAVAAVLGHVPARRVAPEPCC